MHDTRSPKVPQLHLRLIANRDIRISIPCSPDEIAAGDPDLMRWALVSMSSGTIARGPTVTACDIEPRARLLEEAFRHQMIEQLCAKHTVKLPEPTRLRDCQAQSRHFQVLASRSCYERVRQRCSSFVRLCVLHNISFVAMTCVWAHWTTRRQLELLDDGLCDTRLIPLVAGGSSPARAGATQYQGLMDVPVETAHAQAMNASTTHRVTRTRLCHLRTAFCERGCDD